MKKILFLIYYAIFFALIPQQVLAQNVVATIVLKAGAKIQGSINPNQDFNNLERVNFTDQNNQAKSIPLKAIKEIKSSAGKVLYPVVATPTQPTPTTTTSYTQVSQYDKIILKAGAKINAQFQLQGQNPNQLSKINFIDQDGNSRSIPLTAISQLIDRYGNTIYSAQAVVQQPAPTPKVCNKDALVQEMNTYLLQRYNEIKQSIETETNQFAPASYALESQVIDKVYKTIAKDVESLKTLPTSLDAKLKIYVDKQGKLVKIEEDIKSYKQLRNYTRLKEDKIYPYLKSLKYPTSEKAIEFQGEYEQFYTKYKNQIQNHSCPASEFNDVLNRAKEKFKSLEKNIEKTGTFYIVPIQYNFVQHQQKWTYYNNVLRAKIDKKFTEIKSAETKEQFTTLFTKKQKNGIYKVNATYYTALNDSSRIHINKIKRKYKYQTHVGVSVFAHAPLFRLALPTRFHNSFGDIYTFNVKVIFHRIGFFGGTIANFNNFTKRETGYYIEKNFPTYGEGGLYVGLAQWFYLKAGYAYLKTDIAEYKNTLPIKLEKDVVSHGFIFGMALMFPYANIEWGYNSNLGSLYVGAGLHLTFNK